MDSNREINAQGQHHSQSIITAPQTGIPHSILLVCALVDPLLYNSNRLCHFGSSGPDFTRRELTHIGPTHNVLLR